MTGKAAHHRVDRYHGRNGSPDKAKSDRVWSPDQQVVESDIERRSNPKCNEEDTKSPCNRAG